MSRAFLAAAGICAAAMVLPSPARANGRFPESNQVLFAAHDPELLLLRVTFGLLVSHDRGHTFDWVCEQSIGFSGVEDPMYTVTPSNAILGTTFQGLTISRDRACGWSFAGGDLAEKLLVDLSASPSDPKRVVVFSSSYDRQDDAGNILFDSKLYETTDEGQTFAQLGSRLDTSLLGYTVDVTRTDPDRLYVSGITGSGGPTQKAVLLTSKDHGKTWAEDTIQLEGRERSLYIAAVDPNDAERVYLRTGASADVASRILVREVAQDGGPATFRTVFTGKAGLLGFALSPDGSKMYVGGPKDGVLVGRTTDFQFEPRSPLEVACLGVSAEGLWACSNEANGFILGLSRDDGASFEPRLKFSGIRGPLACPPDSPTSKVCGPGWAAQRSILGLGTTPTGDGGATDGGADAGPPGAAPSASSCSCQAGPGAPLGAAAAFFGVLAAGGRRLVRRRRQ